MPDIFNPYQAWLGLSESLADPNHYELLASSPFEPDTAKLSQAADRAFERVRSFVPGTQAAEWAQLLARVTTAKACLLDAARKAEYDVGLRRKIAGHAPLAVYNPQAPIAFAPPTPGMPGPVAAGVHYYSPAPYVPQVPQALPAPQPYYVPQATHVVPVAYQAQPPTPVELPRTYLGARLAKKHSQRASYGLLATGVVFALLLSGGGMFLLAGILSNGKQAASKGGKPKPSPVAPDVEPAPSADPRPKPNNVPSAESIVEPKPEIEPQPKPEPPPGPKPESKPEIKLTPEELAALGRALKAARLALGENNLEDADEALLRAASLAKQGEHQAQVRRLKELAHYVREFWRAVEAGRQDLRGGEELEIGNTRIAVVEPGPGKFIYKSQGALCRCELREIPGGIALVIAQRKLVAKDSATQIILGAIYAASKNADKKTEARRHWNAALASGADVKDLLLVLDDTYDFEEQNE